MTPAAASLALSASETGELVYQPAEQAAELQVIELVGAAASDCAVKLVVAPESPALSCAHTAPDCVPAAAVNVYAPTVWFQPAPRAG